MHMSMSIRFSEIGRGPFNKHPVDVSNVTTDSNEPNNINNSKFSLLKTLLAQVSHKECLSN